MIWYEQYTSWSLIQRSTQEISSYDVVDIREEHIYIYIHGSTPKPLVSSSRCDFNYRSASFWRRFVESVIPLHNEVASAKLVTHLSIKYTSDLMKQVAQLRGIKFQEFLSSCYCSSLTIYYENFPKNSFNCSSRIGGEILWIFGRHCSNGK